MNLTEFNLNGKSKMPIWKKEYSAKDAFNMSSIYPNDWDSLINHMLNNLNNSLVDSMIRFYTKSSDINKSCDDQCKKSLLCRFKQARSDHFIKC